LTNFRQSQRMTPHTLSCESYKLLYLVHQILDLVSVRTIFVVFTYYFQVRIRYSWNLCSRCCKFYFYL